MKNIREKLTRAMRTRINLYGYGFPDAADVLYEVPNLLDRLEAAESSIHRLNIELQQHKDALAQSVPREYLYDED
jgi:hypothetical protein